MFSFHYQQLVKQIVEITQTLSVSTAKGIKGEESCGPVRFFGPVSFIKDYGPDSMSPGVEVSMSNAVGKAADRTGYHLKALQEIRNSLRPFATENGSPSPTLPKDGHLAYQQHLYHPYSPSSGYIEVCFLLLHQFVFFFFDH